MGLKKPGLGRRFGMIIRFKEGAIIPTVKPAGTVFWILPGIRFTAPKGNIHQMCEAHQSIQQNGKARAPETRANLPDNSPKPLQRMGTTVGMKWTAAGQRNERERPKQTGESQRAQPNTHSSAAQNILRPRTDVSGHHLH